MKKIAFYFIAVLAAVAVSCTEREYLPINDNGNFNIKLTSGEISTKAGTVGHEAGVESLNENTISTVDVFIFSDVAAPAVYSATNVSITNYSEGTASISSTITNDVISKVTSASVVYVIANRPSSVILPASLTLQNLKALRLPTADFTTTQSLFVMDGSAALTKTSAGITGNVSLKRSASKIGLFITALSKATDDDGVEWEADPSSMTVSLFNGVKNTNLDVTYDGCSYDLKASDYFNISKRAMSLVEGVGYSHDPFYSYPSDWSIAGNKESYIILTIGWQQVSDETKKQTCYYQVPVNADGKMFERNCYYKVNVKVGVLESNTPNDPIVLTPSVYILDWNTAEVLGDLTSTRYLVVDRNNFKVDNEDNFSINYSTSNDCELTHVLVTYYDLLKNESKIEDASKYNSSLETAGVIKFSHNLDNDWGSDGIFDCFPFTISFRISHIDDPTFYEDVTITQNPRVTIAPELNSGTGVAGVYPESNSDYGYVWVNNDRDSYGNVNGFYNASNTNENRYIIGITALESSLKYSIGDPRESDVDNLSTDWSAYAPGIEGAVSRQLTNYYPSSTESWSENMIAPKYMVASSYGVTSTISFSSAQKRCASYQEEGYPAGRWRIPTSSEVEFICTLSNYGKIPILFGSSSGSSRYWCSNGYVTVNPSASENKFIFTASTSGSNCYVRCVYDYWYWTDKCDKDTFTWGDKAR